jgi:hypothetical protein
MDAENKYQYSGADIIRYLEGRMGPKEMRNLELAAMNDPFLEDAIEGFREAYALDKTAVLSGLHLVEKMEEHSRQFKMDYTQNALQFPAKTKSISLWNNAILKWATAAVFLVGSGWFLFQYLGSTNNENALEPATIAATKVDDNPKFSDSPQMKDQAESVHVDIAKTEESQTISPNQHTPKIARSAASKKAPKDSEQSVVASIFSADEETGQSATTISSDTQKTAIAKTEISSTNAASEPFKNEHSTIVVPSTSARAKSLSITKQHLEDIQPQRIRGSIVDNSRMPLDNITLQVKGYSLKTISDELGRFEMVLPDTNVTLIASGIGYKTKEFNAGQLKNTQSKLELQLEPKRNFEEELVVGYLQNKKADEASPRKNIEMDTAEAAPIIGWEKYLEYIYQNNRLKKASTELTPVVLIFEVEEDGKPTNIFVVKSGGKEYDQEAKRLVKEGPLWKIKIEDEESAAVRITLLL